jgi:hypothetical protein
MSPVWVDFKDSEGVYPMSQPFRKQLVLTSLPLLAAFLARFFFERLLYPGPKAPFWLSMVVGGGVLVLTSAILWWAIVIRPDKARRKRPSE